MLSTAIACCGRCGHGIAVSRGCARAGKKPPVVSTPATIIRQASCPRTASRHTTAEAVDEIETRYCRVAVASSCDTITEYHRLSARTQARLPPESAVCVVECALLRHARLPGLRRDGLPAVLVEAVRPDHAEHLPG